jgi:heme-degrading monooxygenase HmoA
MLARLWTTGLRPERVDAYETFARHVSLPMFRDQDGFIGCVMVRSGHEGLVLTLWRDQSAVDALERSPAYRGTVKRIQEAELLAGPQHTAIYQLHLIDVGDVVRP